MPDINSIQRGAFRDHAAELRRRNKVFDSDPEFGGPLDKGPERWLMEHRHEIADAIEKATRLDEAERLLREAVQELEATHAHMPEHLTPDSHYEAIHKIKRFLDADNQAC